MYYLDMENTALSVETINFVPKKPDKVESSENNKFNFLEVLIIIAAIAVVVMLALLAINPNKQAAEARNIQRKADVSMILSQVSSYVLRNYHIPSQIPTTKSCVEYMNEICKTGPYDCTDLVNMSFLNQVDTEELTIMPNDPKHISINGTGYYIFNDGDGVVTVCAPYAERNEEISFSKYMY